MIGEPANLEEDGIDVCRVDSMRDMLTNIRAQSKNETLSLMAAGCRRHRSG